MMIDRKTLIQRRNRVLRWVQSKGAVFCYDENEIQRLKEYLVDIPAVFPELLQEGLCAIYLYRQEVQPEGLDWQDAIAWIDVTRDLGTISAIGISFAALTQGPAYTQLCWLHEYTHVIHGGEHDSTFHAALDGLIDRFNKWTGSHILNDYYGLFGLEEIMEHCSNYITPTIAEKAFLSERTPNSAAEAARARMLERMALTKEKQSSDRAREAMIQRMENR